jgi:hypothetical protein
MEAKSIEAESRLWVYPDFLGNWLLLSRCGFVQQLAAAVIHISMAAAVIFLASQAGARRRCSRSPAIHGAAVVVRLEMAFGCHCCIDAPSPKVRLPEMIFGPLDSFSSSRLRRTAACGSRHPLGIPAGR